MKDVQIMFAERYSATGEVKKIVPGFKYGAGAITSSSNLTQRVLKVLLTEYGSNAYTPELGTAIRDFTVMASSNADEAAITSMAGLVITQTETQIKGEQKNYTTLAPDEILDRIEIIDIFFNGDTNAWKIRMAIYNQNNNVSVVEI